MCRPSVPSLQPRKLWRWPKHKLPISYPRVQPDYCGYPGFTISCNDKGKPVFNLSNSEYIIHEIHYQNQSLRVSNAAVYGKSPSCTPQIQNVSLDDGRFHRSSNSKGLFLLYNCNSTLLSNKSELSNYKVDCPGENETVWTLAMLEDDPLLGSTLDKCGTRVLAPVDVYRGENVGTERMLLLEEGFVLNWTAINCSTCHDSGGKCGFDAATYHFKCFCPDGPHSKQCYSESKKLRLKLGLGLGLGEELALRGAGNEVEKQNARKMILASLWCIQTDPSNRPPMSRVVEMLQGSLESLPIPPKPYLSSPPRSPHGSNSNSETTTVIIHDL
ncbi:hypothetical protein D5086_019962 [Populus alba]|uniref:Uncharacterized protein n=1 Tax=Populus alba TaxID=43335 RepID=A0ACC4BIP9_POPAL